MSQTPDAVAARRRPRNLVPAELDLSEWDNVQPLIDELLGRELGSKDDVRRWRRLALLVLHEVGGWPPARLARAFDTDARHVRRDLSRTRRDLAAHFRPEPPGPGRPYAAFPPAAFPDDLNPDRGPRSDSWGDDPRRITRDGHPSDLPWADDLDPDLGDDFG